MMQYVYTIAAVKAKLRRGAKSVLYFVPNEGRLVRVSKRNLHKWSKRA